MRRRAGDNIFLIGPMGSGKSTVGRALARLLGLEFIDTDLRVERKARGTIAQIFAGAGEPSFRKLESSEIAKAARGRGRVIAVGGGAVMKPANRRVMRARGTVVYLEVSAQTALRRAAAEGIKKRPLLSAGGGLAAMRRLLGRRRPLYRSSADFSVRAGATRPDAVAQQIARRLEGLLE